MLMWQLLLLTLATAKIVEHNFTASWVERNPDGVHPRRVIALNGQWPLPVITADEDDRVIIRLQNDLGDDRTLLHFHGLFQKGTPWMDGPEMVTQCPVVPGLSITYNFTVNQAGTYWYHLHLGLQYSDGLRGMLVIKPKSLNIDYDHETTLSLSDWYHLELKDIMDGFMSRYNPTGAEPIPQNALFNDTRNATWTVEPEKTYLVHICNMGMFVLQYLYIEDHKMTVVEIDGVATLPYETESLKIAVAQRYSVLVTPKAVKKSKAFKFINILDKEMLDVQPDDLQYISTNWMVIDDKKTHIEEGSKNFIEQDEYDGIVDSLKPLDDMGLVPLDMQKLLTKVEHQIILDFEMESLGDGVVYAMFNQVSYTAPKVPTLYTVFSGPKGEIANPLIYGSNSNTYVLKKDEVVEIVLNNMDPGDHPFHLHGHEFQVIERLEAEAGTYNSTKHRSEPKIPMRRDTILVNANGYVVLRFKANNPGVWFFHCHVDWHLEQGLAITLVEDPVGIRELNGVPQEHIQVCREGNTPYKGNAAGNSQDFLDLTGEPVQKSPLPAGFTTKGWLALVLCSILCLYGVISIYEFGIEDVKLDNRESLIAKLQHIVETEDI